MKIFPEENKFEIGLYTGNISSDPFLSVHQYGLSLGFHFNSLFSVHALGWRANVSKSDAYNTFKEQLPGATIDTNEPKSFYGLELDTNLLYGKASLFGKSIIYVDIFLLTGLGMTQTESGNNFTPFIGIGQKIHLSQSFSLHLDYKIMHYQETIISKDPALNHKVMGERGNTTDASTLGVSYLFGI